MHAVLPSPTTGAADGATASVVRSPLDGRPAALPPVRRDEAVRR